MSVPYVLKPCPFCGATSDGRVVKVMDDPTVPRSFDFQESIICDHRIGGCGAEGPVRENVDDAVVAWNRRSAK